MICITKKPQKLYVFVIFFYAPGLGSFQSEEEDSELRTGSGFKDDFQRVVEMKVRANRLHDKRSLPFPPKPVELNFPESNFGTDVEGFSPLTEPQFFGQHFPQNNFGSHENKQPLVVVDPLEGFRKPIGSPKLPQAPEHEEMPEHFEERPHENNEGQIVVGVPLQVSGETVAHRPNRKPQMTSFLSPPISGPEFGQNFEHNPQFDPIHFEVEDARQTGTTREVPNEQPPFKSKPANPFTTSNPLNHVEEQPLSPVINADGPSLDDFPDFFKLRPQEDIEPQLDFMTELGQNFHEDEHDHAKREQPPTGTTMGIRMLGC